MTNADQIENSETYGQVSWDWLSGQPWALPLLMANPYKVVGWNWLSQCDWAAAAATPMFASLQQAALSKATNQETSASIESLADAEAKITKMLATAEAEAARIVAEAHATAAQIIANAKAEAATVVAEAKPVVVAPAPLTTFREKQIALMEAYGVADPQEDFRQLDIAMEISPAKGCSILEVCDNPVRKYHSLRKLDALERKQKKMSNTVRHLEKDAQARVRVAKDVIETVPKLAKAKAVHARATKFFESASKMADAALKQ